MSQIRSKNTKPELLLRKLLFSKGIRGYRLHYNITGKPDLVFPKHKIAIFIDGCFWHGCKKCFIIPKTRKKFWQDKINQNLKRDKIVNRKLKKSGWRVLRIWEHDLVETDKVLLRIKKISASFRIT